MKPRLLLAIAIALALFVCAPPSGRAQSPERGAAKAGLLSLLPESRTTEHAIDVQGRTLRYQVRAGTLSLLGGNAEPTAEVFYVAYTLQPEQSQNESLQRPVTFVFNGGPGAAAAYLHLGAMGPRVLMTGTDGSLLPSPQKLIDNPDTWLDMTDLVFVDPVGTGYSREVSGQQARNFWGVNQDAASMGAFVRLYLAQTERTRSPVFLAGESYGGFRAALLSRTLQQDIGISPSGIVLVCPALEFALLRPDEFDILHYALELLSLAAVRLGRDGVVGQAFQDKLVEIERFALGDYLAALAGGLESGGRAVSRRVAEITGLPLELVQRSFARISTGLFTKEFARARGNVLSPYDGLIEIGDIAPQSPRDRGIALTRAAGPIVPVAADVAIQEAVGHVRPEAELVADISREGGGQGGDAAIENRVYAGVMGDLQRARSLNPAMGVLIVNGYTDLVTPYMISRYLLSQVSTIASARPVRSAVLDGGHMMYLRPDGRRALKELAVELYRPTP